MVKQRVGELGEHFVAQCLEQRGWEILARRWRCRWGELDIVAQAPAPVQYLIFVEVKVRGDGNWDQSGLLSITRQKQQKLILAAQAFLADNVSLGGCHCRFDVALVTYEKKSCESFQQDSQGVNLTTLQASSNKTLDAQSAFEGAVVDNKEFQFVIQHYLQGAFDAES